MSECRTCRFYAPGDRFPKYAGRGACGLIHATSTPERRAKIAPAGNAWLVVDADFGCVCHEPKDPTP